MQSAAASQRADSTTRPSAQQLSNQRSAVAGSAARTRSGFVAAALLPGLTALLAVVAGIIHLAHNYLPMEAPAGGPPPTAGAGAPPAMAGGGLLDLVMPHLGEVMLLNFVAFVGLAGVLLFVARLRPRPRISVDALLALLSATTLYAWNAMGRSNPMNTGILALVAELGLIVLAVSDAILLHLRRI